MAENPKGLAEEEKHVGKTEKRQPRAGGANQKRGSPCRSQGKSLSRRTGAPPGPTSQENTRTRWV